MFKINKITSNPTVDYAAEELKKYLRMMMPDAGEIIIKYAPEARDGFRLGLMADFGLDVSEAEDVTIDDILHIDTDAEGGIIAGSNVRSVLLAVYKYLTLNGCRWLFPGIDGEFIPVKDVAPTAFHKMADNRYRGWCNEGAEFQQCMIEAIDFAPKIGLNTFMLEFFNPAVYYSWYYNHLHNQNNREAEPVTRETTLQWKRQCEAEIVKRGLVFSDVGHGWTNVAFDAHDEEFFEKGYATIPEENKKYLALVNGKRDFFRGGRPGQTNAGRPGHTNMCFSNEEGRKKVVDFVVNYAKKAPHVDLLCFSLADSKNNHCECEECIKKTPADWLVILLNEIDEELTKYGLDTRIRFSNYLHTLWAPKTERLKNPKRFFQSLAAISREYWRTIPDELPNTPLMPYVHNKVVLPETLAENMLYAFEWQKLCKVPLAAYEYHFYVNQYMSPNPLRYAKITHDDVKGYHRFGFSGIIEDGTQRPFFPNGVTLYVYAQTLFDVNADFDTLVDDYLSHAYGEEYKTVKEYFEALDGVYNHKYLAGYGIMGGPEDPYYDPEEAAKMRGIYELNKKFVPFFEAHKNMPYRAQTVAFRLLARYAELWENMTKPLILKALGANAEASEEFRKVLDDFGKYEVEIERYYDQHMFGMGFDKRFSGKLEIMNIAAR